MGHKYSTNTSNWSTDDWAFGTGENVVQLDEVIVEAKELPMKYFLSAFLLFIFFQFSCNAHLTRPNSYTLYSFYLYI